MESLLAYIPSDRLEVLAYGETLPDRTTGAALFADISGFTPLTEALAREFGPQRGAEELSRYLNMVFDALVDELHHYGGSATGFSGDAMMCWFDGDSGVYAVTCALAMQRAMERFASVVISSGRTVSLAMKAAVATGPVRRFLVGDPEIQIMDTLAGALLDRLTAAEHQARRGEVVLDPGAVAALGEQIQIREWRQDHETGLEFAVVGGMTRPVSPLSWAPVRSDKFSEEQIRPWLLPSVYERLASGRGEFLAELRPAVALFVRFGGIDYDGDAAAGQQLDAFVRAAQRVLTQYEAYLIQLTIGDKGSYFLASFGAPLAHEDDAARAAAAALELRALVSQFDFIHYAQIGISQGRLRVGAYGGTTRRTYGVLGDDVNLAARLMQVAAPNQILVSQVTRQTAGDRFTWESLPDIRVKGKAEPISVSALVGLKERQGAHLQIPVYALPMVGREAELTVMEQKLEWVLQGHGQIVGVTGEAGIGKSRLVAEAIRRAVERGLTGYDGECESYGTNASYLVWQSIWRQFFGLGSAWSLQEQTQAVQMQLAWMDPALLPRLPLLGAVLGLPIPDNNLTRSFDAKLRKASLESLLVDCLRQRAGEHPVLLVLEDGHWIDPLSHDLLQVIGRAIANLPVLLVLAYRPPEPPRMQPPNVSQLPHFSEIRLVDLAVPEAEQLVRLKLGQFFDVQVELPPATLERITERAQGNPFYIEELLNYLRDRGVDPQDVQALQQLDLPASLHSLILTRIDQLSESQKITLRVASVVGRLFRAAVLWGAYPQLGDPHKVKADLDVLSRLELTLVDAEPELAYLFKHIVTQEVAYESLPYATRAMLHEQIAQYLERTHADSLEQYVDLLAFHYDRSENLSKKRKYLLRAGELAQANYASEAALNYYERVLSLLPHDEKIPIMLKLGKVLELVGKWDEAVKRYQLALELAEELQHQPSRANCLMAIGDLVRRRGQFDEAMARLQEARAIFEALGDEAGVGQVLHHAGTLVAQQGNQETARALYEQSSEIRRTLGDRPRIASLLGNLGILARQQGDFARSRALQEEGLAIRRELGDRLAIATSLSNMGYLALDQGNYAEARVRLEEAVALYREIGDRWGIANAIDNLANAIRAQGDYATARALYRESLLTNRDLGDRWSLANLLEDIGVLTALEGQPERALRLVAAASALRQAINAPLPPRDKAKLDEILDAACANLSLEARAAALAEGEAMSLDRAIEAALSERQ